MRNWLFILLYTVGAVTIHAQSKSWKFTTNKKIPIQLECIESWFVYVPTQSFPVENKIVSLKSFYVMRWETPNMLYRLFLEDLKNSGKQDEYSTAYPDTNIWSPGLEPYSHIYFQNTKYNQYPLLGVSKSQIQKFCDWLTEKVKWLKFKKWKDKKIQFRLPTEAEWMAAAAGGDTTAVYAWKGPYMRYGTGIWAGDYMANFRRVGDGDIFRDETGSLVIQRNTNSKYRDYFDPSRTADIVAPINNYWPNSYGTFCMTGNVREMVQEDGFTKGGSWIDPGGECQIQYRNTYQKEGYPCEGFRLVAEVE